MPVRVKKTRQTKKQTPDLPCAIRGNASRDRQIIADEREGFSRAARFGRSSILIGLMLFL
jgi:hypothetical protein